MKIRPVSITIITFILLASMHTARSQSFVNLDFEHPVLPFVPVNSRVAATDAIPGWTPYISYGAQDDVAYNIISLGGAQVSLEGPGSPVPAIEGNYSVMLQGSLGGLPTSAGIGQFGQIPMSAQSLIVFGLIRPEDVTFGSGPIPPALDFNQVGTAANYNIYEADISALAGQTGYLLFTAKAGYTTAIDNIIFSSSPVPEPSSVALLALGGLFFLSRRFVATHKI